MLAHLGRQLLREGRPREAIRHLEEAVRLAPESATPVGILGFALFRVGDYGGAAECLEDSLRKEPDDPVLWALLGASLDETGRPEGAVNALETAVFAKADYGWAWGRLGKALRALGRHEEAVRAYEKSVEHGFAPPVLWQDLGESAAELRDVVRLKRACRELGRLDADMAKALRKKLRRLRSDAATA
jgi:predicted Zn-dependent protease